MAGAPARLVKELRERTGAGMMDCKAAIEACGGDIEKAVWVLRQKGIAQAAQRVAQEAKEGVVAGRVEKHRAALLELNCQTDFVARTGDFKSAADFLLNQVLSEGESVLSSGMAAEKISELSAKVGERIMARRAKRLESPDGFLFVYIHSNQKIGVMVEIFFPKGAPSRTAFLDEVGKNLAMQVAASNPLCVTRQELPSAVLERERAVFQDQTRGKPAPIAEKIIQGQLEKFYQTHCLLEQPFVRDDKLSVQKWCQEVSSALGGPLQVRQFVRFQLGEALAA